MPLAVEQRIPRAVGGNPGPLAADAAGQRVVGPAQALEEAQVVDRALVAGELVAVVVGRVGDDRALVEVVLELQRRQVVLVRVRNALWRRRVELAGAGIGVGGPVGRLIVLLTVLIHDARRDREGADRLPDAGQAQHQGVRVVDVVGRRLVGGRIDAVDPAAVGAVPGAGAKPQGAVDDGAAVRDSELVTRLAVLGVGSLSTNIGAGSGEARLRHDVAHGATL